MKKIKLGDHVKDTITSYEGICVGITNWLNGCARIAIQSTDSRNSETGLPTDNYWVDETTVVVVKKQTKQSTQKKNGASSSIGGRYDDPVMT